MKVYSGMDPRLPLSDVGPYARRVEALGYDGLHVAETVHDGLSVALLALEHSNRLVVRTSVVLAFVRSPTLTAYSAWDLQRFSSGRFELGLGTQIRQNIEDRYAMPWSEPIARMRDYVGAVRALFESFATGSPPEHRGPHYRVTRLQAYFNPGPDPATPPPPIFLGGVNAGACQLAGEVADGFVTHPTNSNPRYLEEICLPNLEEGMRRAGRRADEVELVVGAPVITGATRAELDAERERQRRLFAFLYSTPAYRRTLELYGWEDLAGELQRRIRSDDLDDLGEVVTDEILETVAATATYEELPDVLAKRVGARADGVLLAPPADERNDAEFAAVLRELQRR